MGTGRLPLAIAGRTAALGCVRFSACQLKIAFVSNLRRCFIVAAAAAAAGCQHNATNCEMRNVKCNLCTAKCNKARHGD